MTRPAWSACLQQFLSASDPARLEALRIIEEGQRLLSARPRADMPGFQLVSEREIRQQAKYDALQQAEQRARQAIVRGEKEYGR